MSSHFIFISFYLHVIVLANLSFIDSFLQSDLNEWVKLDQKQI